MDMIVDSTIRGMSIFFIIVALTCTTIMSNGCNTPPDEMFPDDIISVTRQVSMNT
ncbi:hypothetical protein JCM21531_1035 [Acetivibrio straminisolvens JCM 21531]|uniref:Uncharacterized protein n=1 Tax=Acetivibrio straminisolvens JCM 21531 TaxID=1294263 RepID=W4V3D7_9FIRM|nr:hypothetical protein JCM21531_1035 [Acetivibrio straminisolvens JCM 21531]